MGNPEGGGYEPPEMRSQLAREMYRRANSASEKVRKKFMQLFRDLSKSRERDDEQMQEWVDFMGGDLKHQVGEPGFIHEGSMDDERRELYFVLTGKEMEFSPEEEKYYGERKRQERAQAFRLSPDATWEEINEAETELRQTAAKRRGLSPDATWEEIMEKAQK